MEEFENKEKGREEIFSKAVRAGKRTYFFDVKTTKSEDYYLTITESKKRFNSEDGTFSYEKHKLFLYKEDFEKFAEGLHEVIDFIQTGQKPEVKEEIEVQNNSFSNIDFEDLNPDSDK
ncbi:MAG: DUF3276 family protein [Bacteroidetes bacterium]|nr:DUF3276 family protein [Bacteroidota bacterium]